MKTKSMVVALMVAVLMVSVLTGCPKAPVTPPVDAVDNPQGDVEQPNGMVIVSGKLFDPNKATTREIGDMLKRQIVQLNFNFYHETALDGSLYYVVPVEQGSFYAQLPIRTGNWCVWVEAIDINGQCLFYDSTTLTVAAGDNLLEVSFAIVNSFLFKFTVEGLPGEYDDYGQAEISTNSGDIFYVQYSVDRVEGQEPLMVFYAYLPTGFDGQQQQAILKIQDRNKKAYYSEIGFNIFQATEGMMSIPYQFPSWMGDVNVDITFEYELT